MVYLSLYGQYIKELRGQGILETDAGFATYIYYPEAKECYMVDVYVVPSKRNTGVARGFVNTLIAQCKADNLTKLTTTVIASHNNSSASLQTWLRLGFKLLKSDSEKIVLIKEIV